MNKYETRVVLFLDILGFKDIISKTVNKGKDVSKKIQELYDVIDVMTDDFTTSDKSTKVITQFSDSIVISFKEEEEEAIILLFEEIQSLIVKLILKNIICRGAISYGKLIHNDKIIFGPALNDAYETETKAAMYPRVILDRSIVDIAIKYLKSYKGEPIDLSNDFSRFGLPSLAETLVTHNLQKDTDEKFYIDYFFSVILNYKNEPERLKSYLSQLSSIIVKGQQSEKPDIKVKYGWMKNKYNSMIENGIRGKYSGFTLMAHPLYRDKYLLDLKPL